MATPELSSSGLPQKTTDELASIYVSAIKKISDTVLSPGFTSISSAEFKMARANSLGFQIDQILKGLKFSSAHWVGQNLPQAFIDGIQRAQTQAREVKVDAPPLTIGGAFSLIDERAITLIARDITGDLGKAADANGKQAKTLLRATAQRNLSEADIDRVIAHGIIQGTPAQAIRELRDQFRAIGDGKVRVKDKNGDMMEFEAGYYARMVVRTKTREATVDARHGRLQELGLDLVAVIGKLSKNFCTAYLGEVYSLSGRSNKYPAYSSLPSHGAPFHPQCSKSTRPFVEALASEKQLDMAEGGDDQDKMLGIDTSEAQRRFKELQIYQQVKKRYATTAAELFGNKAA